MSKINEQLVQDEELFEHLLKTEMKAIPNRQNMASHVISQMALVKATVKYVNHKLMNQGATNGRNKRSNSKEKNVQSSSSK